MSLQLQVMEAPAEAFKKKELYFNAVPRSSASEEKALNLKMIQRGQLVPIIVNRDMVILDGYTRHYLLEQRGVPIKYQFMDFESEEDELVFVRETNVMRRQLNVFQRVEVMYEQLKYEREMRRIRLNTGFIDVLMSLKSGNDTALKIAKDMEVGLKYTNRIIKTMTEKWYIGRNPNPKNKKEFIYHVMPKGEELLLKSKDAKRMGKINISDVIGVHNYTIVKAMYLIENASDEVLEGLRTGKFNLIEEYKIIMGRTQTPRKPNTSWRSETKIKCPNCEHVAMKKEYIKVN